jgi:Zn-dependent peptidase ImmA (M78 family)
MNPYLSVTGIEAKRLAGLLGFNERAFGEWAAGQRRFPASAIRRIASVLGVEVEHLMDLPKQPVDLDDICPAVWFRLRSDELTANDRELVLLLKELGIYMDELEQVLEAQAISWKTIFVTVKDRVDSEAPPRDQGRKAARVFRAATSLAHGQKGIGEVLRPILRAMGLLFVETPLPDSRIEGCTFHVGRPSAGRPCIFVNTAKTTWFRRTFLMMHELAHAIFEAQAGASLDLVDADTGVLEEERADAFAQEAVAPKELLRSLASRHGIDWGNLDPSSLSVLVAETHAEPRLVLRAALEAGFIDPDLRSSLAQVNLMPRLKQITDHALTTQEYAEKYPEKADEFSGKRKTTTRALALTLPVGYIKLVVKAQRQYSISVSRAARLLMITEDDYRARFDEAEPFQQDN